MSKNVRRYRLLPGFKHYEGERAEPLAVGSIVEMTEERYRSLRDRFELVEWLKPAAPVDDEPVDDEDEEIEDDDDEDEDEDEEIDEDDDLEANIRAAFTTMTARDAVDYILLVSEPDVLSIVESIENERDKPRKTVLSAIEAQRDLVGDPEED